MKKRFIFAIIILLLSACTKDSEVVTAISFEEKVLTLGLGDEQHLTVMHYPSSLDAPTYEWESSDPTIISVQNGYIKTLKLGTSRIIVKSEKLNLKSYIDISVIPVEAESIIIKPESLELQVGEKHKLEYSIYPENTTEKEIEWSLTNQEVASIENDVLTAHAIGETEIICKLKNSTVEARFTLTVSPIKIESITLSKESLDLFIGQEETILATILPENATNKELEWTSTNNAVATVDNGQIKALGEGVTEVICKSKNGEVVSKCVITVSPITIESITLSKESLDLFIGQEETILAAILPENATNKELEWTSTNNAVATVDNGQIKALGEGVTEVICKSKNGEVVSKCVITVSPITIESITLSKESLDLFIGQEETILAAILPENATNKELEWTSTNNAVATVNNGRIKALGEGVTEIICKSKNGEIASKCVIRVKPIMVESITLSKESLDLFIGQEETILAAVLPENATNKELEWTSTNNAVATVNNGRIKALGEGVTEIICKSKNGEIASKCVIRVKPIMVESIKLNIESLDIEVNEFMQLHATIAPVNATNQELIWSSSNSLVAKVDRNGFVTALSVGNCEITAKLKKGNYETTCSINVNPISVKNIELNTNAMTLLEGDRSQLTASVQPIDAANIDVSWESSNSDVASVDNQGNIVAHKKGIAIISVTSSENESIYSSCTIIVKDITDFVSSHFPSKSTANFNGIVTSVFSVSLINRSDNSIEYIGFEVKDANGRILLSNSENQNLSAFENITINGSVKSALNPIVVWTYKYNNQTYTLKLPIAD